jgi:nitrous oxidase accessory protein NosD
MFTRRSAPILLIAALALGAVALPAQAAVRHIDGTVVSKNADDHSFRIRTQNGNRIRIKVTSTTRFERLAGFGALRKGLAVEVDAKSTANGLVATQVETPGGGGGADGGGDDHGGGGADDGPNHT